MLAIIGIIAVLVIAINIYFKIVKEKQNGYVWVGDSYDEAVQILTENFSTDIVLYGEPLEFRKNVVYRYIDVLSDETLTTDKEYEFIIINDLDGTTELTEEDIEILKKHVLKGKANLYYLGTQRYNVLKTNGFTIFDRDLGEWGFTCEHLFGELVYGGGLWSSYDEKQSGELKKENLCTVILMNMVHYLKDYN